LEIQSKGMQKNRIEISSKHKKDLAIEFNTSLTTVQMSLDFVFNSEQAVKIREKAKEMLLKEVDKVN